MADSFFVPKYLLDQVPDSDKQAVVDDARRNFFIGLFGARRGLGGGLLKGTELAQNTAEMYLKSADEARKRQEKAAFDDVVRSGFPVDPGVPMPRDTQGNQMPGPWLPPSVGSFDYNRMIQNPRAAFIADKLKGVKEIYGPNRQVVNGMIVDINSKPEGTFIPRVGENQVLGFDSQGRPVTAPVAGAAQAVSTLEGAKSGAQEAAKAQYATERVYNPATGQMELRSRLDVVRPKDGQPVLADPGPLDAEVAKKNADVLTTGFEKAKSARSTLEINATARPYLENSITGFGAEEKLAIARALNAVGFVPNATVADTEAFMLTKARTVLDTVKQLGSGVSISNADRDFAERIAGGKITLNKETITRLLNIEDKLAKQAINSHNSTVGKLFTKDRPTIGGAGADYWRVDIPGQSVVTNPPPGAPAAGAQPAPTQQRPTLDSIFQINTPKR